jgi:hypothetical protein
MPAPRNSRDVALLLQYGAFSGLTNTEMAVHLTEMSALFPREMMAAYRTLRARQAGEN